MHTYSRESLLRSIERVGIEAGDTVSLQVSIGRLGMPEAAQSVPEISHLIIDAFMFILGASGTLIVPTYTYSIGKNLPFEVEATPSEIGEFTEVFRKRSNVIRSRDPMLSNCGIGPNAPDILRSISRSCCGSGSVFSNLRESNAKICTLGVGLYYATFIQHIEEMAAVPFRFHKEFTGTIIENGVRQSETWTYYAAPFLPNCEPHPLQLERLARASGIVKITDVGRGQLFCVSANDYYGLGIKALTENPWLTAKGPVCPTEHMLAHMSRQKSDA